MFDPPIEAPHDEDELLARWEWFVETGDLKPWSGLGASVSAMQLVMREDAKALLARLAASESRVDRVAAVVEAARVSEKALGEVLGRLIVNAPGQVSAVNDSWIALHTTLSALDGEGARDGK